MIHFLSSLSFCHALSNRLLCSDNARKCYLHVSRSPLSAIDCSRLQASGFSVSLFGTLCHRLFGSGLAQGHCSSAQSIKQIDSLPCRQRGQMNTFCRTRPSRAEPSRHGLNDRFSTVKTPWLHLRCLIPSIDFDNWASMVANSWIWFRFNLHNALRDPSFQDTTDIRLLLLYLFIYLFLYLFFY